MCTTPSAPPESARFTAVPTEPLRLVSTRSSIGSDTPDTPSTCPSFSRRDTTLPGVAPKMSVSTSTPSPASSCSRSSRARSTRSSGSSWRQTESVATCCGAPPRIWFALASIAVPISPWVTSNTPIIGMEKPSLQPGFESGDEGAGDVEAALILDLAEAGRTGDIHLGKPVADDVEAHQQQPSLCERRAQGGCNFKLAGGKGLRHAARAGGEIAARLAGLRNAREAMRHRLAVDQQHAVVAFGDLGDVALRHHHAFAALRHDLHDHVAVRIVDAHAEDVLAAHDVEALHHHVALLVDEGLDARGLARNERRCDEGAELGDRELLVMVANGVGRVEYLYALAHGGGQEPGAGDVFEVERRILAHQHRGVVLQRLELGLVAAVPVLVVVGERDARGLRADAVLRPVEMCLFGGPDGVAARLRCPHHRHARVYVRLEGL